MIFCNRGRKSAKYEGGEHIHIATMITVTLPAPICISNARSSEYGNVGVNRFLYSFPANDSFVALDDKAPCTPIEKDTARPASARISNHATHNGIVNTKSSHWAEHSTRTNPELDHD